MGRFFFSFRSSPAILLFTDFFVKLLPQRIYHLNLSQGGQVSNARNSEAISELDWPPIPKSGSVSD